MEKQLCNCAVSQKTLCSPGSEHQTGNGYTQERTGTMTGPSSDKDV